MRPDLAHTKKCNETSWFSKQCRVLLGSRFDLAEAKRALHIGGSEQNTNLSKCQRLKMHKVELREIRSDTLISENFVELRYFY